jgi:signal transduction histidine kinase
VLAAWGVLQEHRRRLERDRRELVALHRGARDIYDELGLDHVLQKVVEHALPLVEARYGALSVMDDDGRIRAFVTSGSDLATRTRIGDPPSGHGLLGVPLNDGQALRVAEIGADPRSVGFPEHHPPMKTLLAVPVPCKSPFRSNLYVAEKASGRRFNADDEATLTRFALTAGLAIDLSYTHRSLTGVAVGEERVRIAREMHDGMAQVLAYVNTKAQAVREFMVRGRHDEAREQLDQLAEAARQVSIEVREGILALRTEVSRERSLSVVLAEYVERWRGREEIEVHLDVDPEVRFPGIVELQLLRIVQEALSNVRKHARAENAWVRLARVKRGSVVLEVRDDGRGFDPAFTDERGGERLPRFGLAIMQERAQAIGGTIEFDSQPSRPRGGTRVRVELPYPETGVAL